MDDPLYRQSENKIYFGWCWQMWLLIVQLVFFSKKDNKGSVSDKNRQFWDNVVYGRPLLQAMSRKKRKWFFWLTTTNVLAHCTTRFFFFALWLCFYQLRALPCAPSSSVSSLGNGPGQYLWCFMHQMGSTVQITRATEQQQQSLLLWTAPTLWYTDLPD